MIIHVGGGKEIIRVFGADDLNFNRESRKISMAYGRPWSVAEATFEEICRYRLKGGEYA